MSFQPYKPKDKRSLSKRPGFRLYFVTNPKKRTGQIYFGDKIIAKCQLEKYSTAEFLYDRGSKLMAVRFNNDPPSESNYLLTKEARRPGLSNKRFFVTSISLVREMVKIGYPNREYLGYEITEGLLILKKNVIAKMLVTGKRKPRVKADPLDEELKSLR
jgi:hypothetical protein